MLQQRQLCGGGVALAGRRCSSVAAPPHACPRARAAAAAVCRTLPLPLPPRPRALLPAAALLASSLLATTSTLARRRHAPFASPSLLSARHTLPRG
jgi:hypothetical protein